MTTVRQALDEGRPIEDGRLILAHVLERDPAWLFARPEHELEEAQLARYRRLLHRRAAGEPLAYLTGEREFWSLPLKVTPATLIPRPETELLVEMALQLDPAIPASSRRRGGGREEGARDSPSVLDLGTGSGAIALALARERPQWRITATDISDAALKVARENARRLAPGAIRFLQGDWYAPLENGASFDLILSNPPYVAEDDPHLQGDGLPHEPASALLAGPRGLDELTRIIREAPAWLRPGGWLLTEHGFDQGPAVRELFAGAGFTGIETRQDLAGRDRVTLGCYSESP